MNTTNNDWQKDSRLKSMNPEKVQFLINFAKQLNNVPKAQALSRFLALIAEASSKNISFSSEEIALLTDILTSHLTSADRGRLDMLRMLSQKTASRHS